MDKDDYYFNGDGLMVLTENFLKERGYCCEKGCKHCPYGFNENKSWWILISFIMSGYTNLFKCP